MCAIAAMEAFPRRMTVTAQGLRGSRLTVKRQREAHPCCSGCLSGNVKETIKQHEEQTGKCYHPSLTIVDSEHMGEKQNGQNVQCERSGVKTHCDQKHNDHLGARRE